MDSSWSSFGVVAAVFSAFSGVAWVWGRVQQRRRSGQEAGWAALLQSQGAPHGTHRAEPARSALPPDPCFADCPSFVSDSDSRRAALDEALDRMSRQTADAAGQTTVSQTPASNSADWEDTEPSVTLSAVLPHGAGRRSAGRGSEAA